jgi:hypothetical protein
MDCPAGSVHGNSVGTAEDFCVGPCKPWQYARYRYCETCPAGEVGYLADFKSCRDCPAGSVHGTVKDRSELAICIGPTDALYPCAKWEVARYGYCEVSQGRGWLHQCLQILHRLPCWIYLWHLKWWIGAGGLCCSHWRFLSVWKWRVCQIWILREVS